MDNQPRGFGRALARAEKLLDRRQEVSVLVEKAVRKAEQKKNSLGEVWNDLMVFFNLIRDWSTGAYKGISLQNILIVIGAVIYFLNPFDAIPDFIIGYGFLDDITVIGYVLNSLKKEIDEYRSWLLARDQSSSDS